MRGPRGQSSSRSLRYRKWSDPVKRLPYILFRFRVSSSPFRPCLFQLNDERQIWRSLKFAFGLTRGTGPLGKAWQ
jgi:hypothetical protein